MSALPRRCGHEGTMTALKAVSRCFEDGADGAKLLFDSRRCFRCCEFYEYARLRNIRISLSLSVVCETSTIIFAARSDGRVVLRPLFAEKQESRLKRPVLITVIFYGIVQPRTWSSEVMIQAGLNQSGQTHVVGISPHLTHETWSQESEIWMSIKARMRSMESSSRLRQARFGDYVNRCLLMVLKATRIRSSRCQKNASPINHTLRAWLAKSLPKITPSIDA